MTQNNEGIKNFKIGVKDVKAFEIPEIKDGIYDAVLTDMELKVNVPDGKGGVFDMIQWNFKVGDKVIQGKTSPIINPLSNAYAWIKALTREEPKIGTDFNPLSVQNSKCQISIKHRQKTKLLGSDTQVQSIPYVSDVSPAK